MLRSGSPPAVVDAGTAIFTCSNEPPTGNGARFLTYEGPPSAHYLRLTGPAGNARRGELPPTDAPPAPLPPVAALQ